MEKQHFKVLQVVGALGRGGTETMIMNHLRALDRNRVTFDFIVHTNEETLYEKEALSLGCRIFRAPKIRPWTYAGYFKWLDTFFKEHAADYIAVHGHIQENTGFALHYAKKYGIANRLSSSHTASIKLDFKYPFRLFAKIYMDKNVTVRLACGEDAGKSLYGNASFRVLPNAIDTERFRFDKETRIAKRRQLGIDDSQFVIGHVGTFNVIKNHSFLVKIFSQFIEDYPSSRLLLVGSGQLFNETKALVNRLGLDEKVVFMGDRSDVNELLQAFDVFIMPSLFEGLPVSGIEAQAAGLPCIFSDTIDHRTDITGNCQFIPLDKGVKPWIETLANLSDFCRKDTRLKISDAGYDVKTNLKILLPLYGIKGFSDENNQKK